MIWCRHYSVEGGIDGCVLGSKGYSGRRGRQQAAHQPGVCSQETLSDRAGVSNAGGGLRSAGGRQKGKSGKKSDRPLLPAERFHWRRDNPAGDRLADLSEKDSALATVERQIAANWPGYDTSPDALQSETQGGKVAHPHIPVTRQKGLALFRCLDVVLSQSDQACRHTYAVKAATLSDGLDWLKGFYQPPGLLWANTYRKWTIRVKLLYTSLQKNSRIVSQNICFRRTVSIR